LETLQVALLVIIFISLQAVRDLGFLGTVGLIIKTAGDIGFKLLRFKLKK
jgi:hypothetical protein